MLIAIPVRSQSADTTLNPHFGRSQHFAIVSSTGEGRSFYDNPHADGEHGAGIRAAEFVVGLGVEAVISGSLGPKALNVLEEAGCACFAAEEADISCLLSRWRDGSLKRLDHQASNPA